MCIILKSFLESSTEKAEILSTCVALILNEYLSKDTWHARISNYDNEALKTSVQKEDFVMLPTSEALIFPKCVSFSEINSNIQLLCLLLEGIGIFATALRAHFDRYNYFDRYN